MIFSRDDFLNFITKTMSLARLKKEMNKISRLLMPEESSAKLKKIGELLNKFETGLLVDIANETGSFIDPAFPIPIPSSEPSENSFIDRMQKLMISPTKQTSSKCDKEEKEDIDNKQYEFWVNLDGQNLDTFNYIDSQLLLYQDKIALHKILKSLYIIISDYPPEFFLQPPNVLETFIDILPKTCNEHALEILKFIQFIINGLKERFIEARKQKLQFMPIKKHMNKVIQMFTNFFETFNDNCLDIHMELQQQRQNAIYTILFDMVDLVENTEDVCDIYLNELLNMMAKVVRGFRLAYIKSGPNSDIYRFNYIVLIYLINAFVSRINVENITKYSENNLWEFESDLALLDYTLSHSHPQIYNLIKNNRIQVLKDDKDMNLLLNINATWRPVVDLFQKWETFTDENIIVAGLKCLDTIRIHKSEELIDILFSAIEKCADKFNTNEELKTAAEEIILRLLSNEVPAIRLKAYAMARSCVQKKLTEDQDEKLKNMDLCAIIGIPLTTEIVTEILCFGYCDENETIYRHAKLIIFALLRSKVVFPNHWVRILETIRPVLPLAPCLYKTDQKLGFFSFDVFHEHSGFDDYELNQAFVRFMFCTHQKAREMAKIKLLENLKVPEFTQDFIEIVPDNFCILQDSQVSDLQMPDKNVKFSAESYETVKKIIGEKKMIEEEELLQSVLLQLSVQMNSSYICKLSHNDNLWVYFVGNLDMKHPNNAVIRKLVINILYKWAVTISSFRIYLSNEPSVLQFLIKTLIYFQDDVPLKIQTCSLLFLLSFSDFIVTNEKTISLPKFLNNLHCPFKFEVHWTESPFNKVTQLEWLFEALEIQNENMDIQEITLSYMRYTFGAVWFEKDTESKLMSSTLETDMYYKGLNSKTLKLPKCLILTEKDNKFKEDTTVSLITSNISKVFETVKTVRDLERQLSKISCLMMMPSMNTKSFTVEMMKRMKKYVQYADDHCDVQKAMLVKCIAIYQNLFIPWMSHETVVITLINNPLLLVFKKTNQNQKIDENVYIQMLYFINAVVKECESKKDWTDKIIFNFNKHHKIHFPSNLIEKLCEHLFDVAMTDKAWNDLTKVPSVKVIYTLIRNVLRIMPIELDEKYVNEIFGKFVSSSRAFLKAKKKNEKSGFLNTYIINQIFAVIDALTSLKYNFKINDEDYSTLFLWMKENQKVDKALIWSIIANLTRNKDSYDKFCEGFKDELNFTVWDMVFERIFDGNAKSNYERRSLALVIGNFLDHSSISNQPKATNSKQQMKIIIKLLDQKPICYETMSFVVKKMIQNKVPEVAEIVKQRNMIEKVLNNDLDNLDMILMCHSYDELQEHVIDVVTNISDKGLRDLMMRIENPTSEKAIKAKKCNEYKRMNNNILNILLILMSSSIGIDKIRKIFIYDNSFNETFNFAILSGLSTKNTPNEIVFYIRFLITLLNAYSSNKHDILTSMFEWHFEEKVKSKIIKQFKENPCTGRTNPANFYFNKMRHTSDLFLLQALKIFDHADSLKQPESSYQMRLAAFVLIRNLLNESNRAKIFSVEIKLQEWIIKQSGCFIINPINLLTNSYSGAVKKHGAQKCTYTIRNLSIYLKAVSEWDMPAVQESTMLLIPLFFQLPDIYSWIDSDKILLNIFYQLIQYISQYDILRFSISAEINGTPIIKGILQKVQKETQKIPHTDSSLVLIQNGLYTIKKCCRCVDARITLKNAKVFQLLDLLHPQIQSNKKSTWNEVTEIWLEFFEALSRYEDSECTPGQISLLCRIVRIGNQSMKSSALKIIRNLTMKASLGYVALVSDDFMHTLDLILSDDGNKDDKVFILQTLLSISSKSEQSRAKLKNSSFNRKLREHLTAMEFALKNKDDSGLYNLTSMLKDVLYA
ncbi:protein rotatin homolog [Chironomus tepperi]|uniref:protein rotatin homolog n=1 Tax=Chironomus tepperi TaxID=113505 RepID=UPI00391FB21A